MSSSIFFFFFKNKNQDFYALPGPGSRFPLVRHSACSQRPTFPHHVFRTMEDPMTSQAQCFFLNFLFSFFSIICRTKGFESVLSRRCVVICCLLFIFACLLHVAVDCGESSDFVLALDVCSYLFLYSEFSWTYQIRFQLRRL
jgi:hypothetical protein